MIHFALLFTNDGLWAVAIPLWALVVWVVFMCAVQALPRPTLTDSKWYIFLYRFGHLLSLNIALVLDPKKKFPQTVDTSVGIVDNRKEAK